MSELDDLCTEAEPKFPEPHAAPHYPLIVPGEWPTVYVDSETVRVWCELDEDFDPTMLSHCAYEHSVTHFLYECGLGDLLSCGNWGNAAIDWAIENGVTYRQPFLIEITAHYYIQQTVDGPEGDCDTSYEVLHRKPLDTATVIERFQEWISR